MKGGSITKKEKTMTLEEICRNLKNPLEDDQNLNEIIERMNINYSSCMGESPSRAPLKSMYDLLAMGQNKGGSQINAKDREQFFCKVVNYWIRYMTTLTPDKKNSIRAKYKDLDGLIGLLQKVGKVSSMQEIKTLENNQIVKENRKVPYYDQDGQFFHFKSKYMTGRVENGIDVKHRLYISPKPEDIYKFANIFVGECMKKTFLSILKFHREMIDLRIF